MSRVRTALLGSLLVLASVATASPQTVGEMETGLAAVYSNRLHGRTTASSEVYDRAKLTAAHKTLPFGTEVKVTSTRNGRSVVLRINDRGPVQPNRILDISPAAAGQLGMHPRSMRQVTLEIVKVGDGKTYRRRRVAR
ncbi:MAG: septal ring lytic transglycosylase RlpA family protein [Acidimicrobiia bacterium]|nr:septal ring lytic transglycosylase RlpA family protein [Acidimicrobiia bacterium]